jgi:hypothetical protein
VRVGAAISVDLEDNMVIATWKGRCHSVRVVLHETALEERFRLVTFGEGRKT